jgi:hypothetical protein
MITAPPHPDRSCLRAAQLASGATCRPSSPRPSRRPALPVNTAKTGMRHLYDKPGAHRSHEAAGQAGALGLLAPPP